MIFGYGQKYNKTNITDLTSPNCVTSLNIPALQMGASSNIFNGPGKKHRGYL